MTLDTMARDTMARGTMALDIVFMGTPDFAIAILRAVIDSPHRLKAVFTRCPKAAGRGSKVRRSPVHDMAHAHNIDVLTPEKLDKANPSDLARFAPDVVVTAAYGRILPPSWLSVPRLGCINIHASLLPRWRGAAPIQRAIMAGDPITGVTIIRMNAVCDAGDILAAEEIERKDTDVFADIHDRMIPVATRLTIACLDDVAKGRTQPRRQRAEDVTIAGRIRAEDRRIDWRMTAVDLQRRIHALSPYPGAWCSGMVDGKLLRLKILEAEVLAAPPACTPGMVMPGMVLPGMVLDDNLTIACADGALRPLRLQRSGRQPMSLQDFLRGTPLARGHILTDDDQ